MVMKPAYAFLGQILRSLLSILFKNFFSSPRADISNSRPADQIRL